MSRRFTQFVRYLGLAGAVAVPAVVVAQMLPSEQNLQAGQLLRANDILLIRNALNDALGRIRELEAATPRGLSKEPGRLEVQEGFSSIPAGAIETATARCSSASAIAIDCSCGGDNGPGTNGTTQLDQRIIQTQNPANGTSQCDCVAQNVGTNSNARVIARVTCLIP